MSELEKYTAALQKNDIRGCLRIEQAHGLDGLPPELVSVGLKAYADGEDMYAAIDKYCVGS